MEENEKHVDPNQSGSEEESRDNQAEANSNDTQQEAVEKVNEALASSEEVSEQETETAETSNEETPERDNDTIDSVEAVSDEDKPVYNETIANKSELEDEATQEKKELPQIDFETLQIAEATKYLKQLVAEHKITDVKPLADQLRDRVRLLYEEERDLAKKKYLEEGGEEDGFEYQNQDYHDFNYNFKNYKDLQQRFYDEIKKEQEENLSIRLSLIDQLKALYTEPNEDNSQMFRKFREIKEKWNDTGLIPKNQVSEVFRTYYFHLDNFYEYLNLNKELREMDYSQNLKMRETIIERAKELLNHSDVRKALNELQYLHQLWKSDAVPVAPEHREPTWNQFKDITQQLHDKRTELNEAIIKEREENLKKKQGIIGEIQSLLSAERPKENKEYLALVKKVDQLSNEFRQIGPARRKENQELWKRFKDATKTFNKEKNHFFKGIKEEYNQNIQKKQDLIDIAKEHQESSEWDQALDIMKKIQAEWKRIGFVPRKKSDELWKEFKGACDHFFERYKNRNQIQKKEALERLKKKEALLEELKAEKASGSKEEILEKIGNWNEQWNALGGTTVSRNEVDQQFNQLIVSVCEENELSLKDVEDLKTQQLLDGFQENGGIEKIEKELQRAKMSIRQLSEEITQLETNMGFFANADENNPLVKGVKEKLDQKIALRDSHEMKLRSLKTLIRKQKEQEEAKHENEQETDETSESPNDAAE